MYCQKDALMHENRDVTQSETAAIASGDTEAFARFYEQWFDEMYREAKRFTKRDEAFCLDVVQDAMIRVIRHLRTIHSEPELRKWLMKVVHTAALDRIRSDCKRKERECKVAQRSQFTQSDQTSTTTHETQRGWLQNTLKTLDDDKYMLLMMRYRFGWTLQQIGIAVGLKTGAVDGRINRTVKDLKNQATKDIEI